MYLNVGAASRCCRSLWNSRSSWRRFGSCSRRPGPSSRKVTGKTLLSLPSHQSSSQNSSRLRLQTSHRCGWCTVGTHISDLKYTTQDDWGTVLFTDTFRPRPVNLLIPELIGILQDTRCFLFVLFKNCHSLWCLTLIGRFSCYASGSMHVNGWRWWSHSNTS